MLRLRRKGGLGCHLEDGGWFSGRKSRMKRTDTERYYIAKPEILSYDPTIFFYEGVSEVLWSEPNVQVVEQFLDLNRLDLEVALLSPCISVSACDSIAPESGGAKHGIVESLRGALGRLCYQRPEELVHILYIRRYEAYH